jgi:hypothetical protein
VARRIAEALKQAAPDVLLSESTGEGKWRNT